MTRDQPRLADYLVHITEAIERIARYTKGMNEAAFLNNELVQDAVIRNLEIIGEASNKIEKNYPDFSNKHPEIPFPFAYQMRNVLAHGYFKVDLKIVWRTIYRDLPLLYSKLRVFINQPSNDDSRFNP